MELDAYLNSFTNGRLGADMNDTGVGAPVSLHMTENENFLRRNNQPSLEAVNRVRAEEPSVSKSQYLRNVGAPEWLQMGAKLAYTGGAYLLGYGATVGTATALSAPAGGIGGFLVQGAAVTAGNAAATAAEQNWEGQDIDLTKTSGKQVASDLAINMLPLGLGKVAKGGLKKAIDLYNAGTGVKAWGARVAYNTAVNPLQNMYVTGETGSLLENVAWGAVGGTAEHAMSTLHTNRVKSEIPMNEQGNLNHSQPVNPGDNIQRSIKSPDINVPEGMDLQTQAPEMPQFGGDTKTLPPSVVMDDLQTSLASTDMSGINPTLSMDTASYTPVMQSLTEQLRGIKDVARKGTYDALDRGRLQDISVEDRAIIVNGLESDPNTSALYSKLTTLHDRLTKEFEVKSKSKDGKTAKEIINSGEIELFPNKQFKVEGIDHNNNPVSYTIDAVDYNTALGMAQKDLSAISSVKDAPRSRVEVAAKKKEVIDTFEKQLQSDDDIVKSMTNPAFQKLPIKDQLRYVENEILGLMKKSSTLDQVGTYLPGDIKTQGMEAMSMYKTLDKHMKGVKAMSDLAASEAGRKHQADVDVLSNPILESVHRSDKIAAYNSQSPEAKLGLLGKTKKTPQGINYSKADPEHSHMDKVRDMHEHMNTQEYGDSYSGAVHNEVHSKYGKDRPWNFGDINNGRFYSFENPLAEVLQSANRHVAYMADTSKPYFKHQEIAYNELVNAGWKNSDITGTAVDLHNAVKTQTKANRTVKVKYDPLAPQGAKMPELAPYKEVAAMTSLKTKAEDLAKLSNVSVEQIADTRAGIDPNSPAQVRKEYREAKQIAAQMGDTDTLQAMAAAERLVTNGFEPEVLQDRVLSDGSLLSEQIQEAYGDIANITHHEDGKFVVAFNNYDPNAPRVVPMDDGINTLNINSKAYEIAESVKANSSLNPVEYNNAIFDQVKQITDFMDVVTPAHLTKNGQKLDFRNTHTIVAEKATRLQEINNKIASTLKKAVKEGKNVADLNDKVRDNYLDILSLNQALDKVTKSLKGQDAVDRIAPGKLWELTIETANDIKKNYNWNNKVTEVAFKRSKAIKIVFAPTVEAINKYKGAVKDNIASRAMLGKAEETLLRSNFDNALSTELAKLMIVPSDFADSGVMRNLTSLSRMFRSASSLSTGGINALQTFFMSGKLADGADNLLRAAHLKEFGFPIDDTPTSVAEHDWLRKNGHILSAKQVFGIENMGGNYDFELGMSANTIETGARGFLENSGQFLQRWASGSIREKIARQAMSRAKAVASHMGVHMEDADFKNIFDVEYANGLLGAGEAHRTLLASANVRTLVDPYVSFNALNSFATHLNSIDSSFTKGLAIGVKWANENILSRWVGWYPEELARQKKVGDMNSKAGDIYKELGYDNLGDRIKYGNTIATLLGGAALFGASYLQPLAAMASAANVVLAAAGAIQNEKGDRIESAMAAVDKYDLKGKLGQLNICNAILAGTGAPTLDKLDLSKASVDPMQAFAMGLNNVKALYNNFLDMVTGTVSLATKGEIKLKDMKGDINMFKPKLSILGEGIKAIEEGNPVKGWSDIMQGITGLIGFGGLQKQTTRAVAATQGFIYVPSKASVYDTIKYGFSYAGGKKSQEEVQRMEDNILYRTMYSALVFTGMSDRNQMRETQKSFEVTPVDKFLNVISNL